MIIVTGGAGFIGSNLVKALNERGHNDVLVVDDLSDGTKFRNLVDCELADYLDCEALPAYLAGVHPSIEAIFHQGACADTTSWDGRAMLANNYEYSKQLLAYCETHEIPFIYASSAAVYGAGSVFREERQHEAPLNVYGYSKFLFDQYVRRRLPALRSLVVGLRYFNVYGPREQHKGAMASIAYHCHQQILSEGRARLFEGSGGYGPGEQHRDFVYVDDVVGVNLWFWEDCRQRPTQASGIYNVGTGRSQTFNDVARAIIAFHGRGAIDYIPFPEHLKGRYQSFTQANIGRLRAVGYTREFLSVEQGVPRYLAWLQAQAAR